MTVGPIQFDAPLWLAMAPPAWALAWWIAQRNISGLGAFTRRVALIVRCLVIAALIGAIAQPGLRSRSDDVAVIAIIDVSRSMPPGQIDAIRDYLRVAAESARPDDRLGVVTTASEALVQSLPSKLTRDVVFDSLGDRDATDLAAAIRVATAVIPDSAAGRIALFTDGNETAGSLLTAAQTAAAAGVPIDVLPTSYTLDHEVIFDRLIAPATARQGQTSNLRFVLTATAPTSGRLLLFANDSPVDLDPDSPDQSVAITLKEGTNVTTVPLSLARPGAQQYRAVFEPDNLNDDAITQNNAAQAVTFVHGEGRVLVYADEAQAASELVRALRESSLEVEIRPTSQTHESLVDLSQYDAVVLVDVSAYAFSAKQQEELRAYVHDLGGGLVMVGGPNSFGAGGWIGSPLADALPVKLDPPAKRQMPRGALALIMHSTEIPRGNYWGQQTALAAVNTLSRLDLVGVLEYNWNAGGAAWTYPLSPVGDKHAVRKAINRLTFGDMPDFAAVMRLALSSLANAHAGQKHCIIISDGDPSPPSNQLIRQFVQNKIAISTVAVFPHTGGAGSPDVSKMRSIARTTGGQSYTITSKSQLATLPQIFVKEAKTVRRSLIWEGDPFTPARTNVGAESMRGLGDTIPPISGYIVTADRQGLAQVTLRGPKNDPILAQWQYGLGRSVAFTSDAASRWCAAWGNWQREHAFWEQHVRWAMRPSASANVNVITRIEGDHTALTLLAVDAEGEPLNFARLRSRLVRPGAGAEAIAMRQTGAGRYEGSFISDKPGAYIVSMRYEALVSQDNNGDGDAGNAPQRLERGSAQIASIRPFADEHRALSDNAPLLLEAARQTKGRTLSADPKQANLFSHVGLTSPITVQSIWLLVATASLGLFLIDVAVRRVRIDIKAAGATLRDAFSTRAAPGEQQLQALRTAKATAQRKLASQDDAPQSGSQAPTPFLIDERADDSAKRAAGRVNIITPQTHAPSAGDSAAKQSDEPEQEQSMSRLLRAKRRARDTMDNEDNDHADT